MNCQPNDLAVVVRLGPDGTLPELIGRIVHVTQRFPIRPDLPSWEYEGERMHTNYQGVVCTVLAIPDSMLQPLRNEPDTDEVTTDRTIDEGVAA